MTVPVAKQLLPRRVRVVLNRIYLSYTNPSAHHRVVELVNSSRVLQIMDRQGFIQSGVAQSQQLLTIVYALLALSAVIAILVVTDLLALSIIGRRREIGPLRAIGMQKRQV